MGPRPCHVSVTSTDNVPLLLKPVFSQPPLCSCWVTDRSPAVVAYRDTGFFHPRSARRLVTLLRVTGRDPVGSTGL